jgi:hypothetical protein
MYLSSFVSAKDVISKLCIRTEDVNLSRARLYASYMNAVWNDLRIDITKTSVIRKFSINRATNSLPIPDDCLMLYGVGYEDCEGVVKPLWYNTNMPKHLLFENGVPCHCDTCGEESSICSLIKDVTESQEIITINGINYTKTTKITTMIDGKVIRTITEPYAVNTNGSVVVEMKTTQEELCELEMKPCGCIDNCNSNKEKIKKLECGCLSFDTNFGTYLSNIYEPKNKGYSIDVTGTHILLPMGYEYDYVVLKYLTSISSEEDFRIPSIAEEAFIRGLQYYSEADNPKAPNYEKGIGSTRYELYQAEKLKLRKRLRPFDYQIGNGALGITQDNAYQRMRRINNTQNNYWNWNRLM